jgi:3-methyladenine DNA glycosylase AlkD
MPNAEIYYQYVRERFYAEGKPEIAQGQMAYMRHQFEFFGLKAPHWVALSKAIYADLSLPDIQDLPALTRLCFEDEHREMHYFALQCVEKTMKKQGADAIQLLETLICTRSWWDTVDWIAKLVGMHFKKYPAQIRPVTERWMDSGNMWLQRVSMIFQLAYKDQTDAALLFEYIRRLSGSKEFFIQKGAGWALRQYSRTHPEAVRTFIENTPLAPLTRREGLRLMEK